MKWKTFTPEEIRALRENPYTLKVTDNTIAFTRAFKEQFWQGIQEGKSKHELLKEMGYDPELLGSSRVEGISYHIRKEAERPEGFHEGRRTHTPYALTSELPQAQALRHLQAEVSYLRQEIEFLKKSHASGEFKRMEEVIMGTPSCKYEIIHDALEASENRLSVSELCRIAGVSRSGYYNWLASAEIRDEKETRDRADFQLILDAYSFRGYNKGVRGINMRLLHLTPPIIMNPKKIRRLMRKYGLNCPIRKANPYRRMANQSCFR